MINIGDNSLKSCYIGTTPVKSIYIGSVKVWGSKSIVINNIRSVFSSGNILNAAGSNNLHVIADITITDSGVTTTITDATLTPLSVSSSRLHINGDYINGSNLGSVGYNALSENVGFRYQDSDIVYVMVRQEANVSVRSYNIQTSHVGYMPASGGSIRVTGGGAITVTWTSGATTYESISMSDVYIAESSHSSNPSFVTDVDYNSGGWTITFPSLGTTLVNVGYYPIRATINGVTSNSIMQFQYANTRTQSTVLDMLENGVAITQKTLTTDPATITVALQVVEAFIYSSGARTVIDSYYTSAEDWTVDDPDMVDSITSVDIGGVEYYNIHVTAAEDTRDCNVGFSTPSADVSLYIEQIASEDESESETSEE